MISVLIRSPGWGGRFMGIRVLLMVVDQVNLAGSIRPFVVAENQTPVSGDGQAPEPRHAAFEWVQLPSWEPSELVNGLGGVDGEQQLPQLVGHRGRHPPWRCRLHVAGATLYDASERSARHLPIPVCTVIPYTSRCIWGKPVNGVLGVACGGRVGAGGGSPDIPTPASWERRSGVVI